LFTEHGDVAACPVSATGLLFPTTNTPHSFNSLKWVGNKLQSIITASQHVETFFLWSGKRDGERKIEHTMGKEWAVTTRALTTSFHTLSHIENIESSPSRKNH
jgi:hypothetical protein